MTDTANGRRRLGDELLMPKAAVNLTAPPKPAALDGLDWANLQDHPLAADFNFASGEEIKSLEASIRENGFRVELGKIMLYESKILDGRNRYRACKAVGYKFTGAEFGLLSGDDAEAYVSAAQRRRNLSMDDKKAYARKLFDRHPNYTIRQIAEMAGISKTVAAEVMYPKEKIRKGYEALKKAWIAADEDEQEKFIREFKPGIMAAISA